MRYSGPPPTTPPPPGWRPQVIVLPDPPRQLPPVDHAALDAEERQARRFTWRLGAVALAVAVVVVIVLAERLPG